jgi:hypothetical protein
MTTATLLNVIAREGGRSSKPTLSVLITACADGSAIS